MPHDHLGEFALHILREVAAMAFWTFLASAGTAIVGSFVLQWPLTGTFLLAVLTVGPVLAIQRGRNRETDPLELGERAAAEILVLAILLGLGALLGQLIGK
ncbi:MAG TPA: hypothetical protein VK191_15690 [Symbiobacteriaceae bacterium]|nr:hypothetical protein [Symbiobacteriaceae bacterium]